MNEPVGPAAEHPFVNLRMARRADNEQVGLQLSRKRADAVVRYLTLEKQIPLVRVYVAGYGEDAPAAPNDTRQGREENRRVDVSILAPQSAGSAAEAHGTSSGLQ